MREAAGREAAVSAADGQARWSGMRYAGGVVRRRPARSPDAERATDFHAKRAPRPRRFDDRRSRRHVSISGRRSTPVASGRNAYATGPHCVHRYHTPRGEATDHARVPILRFRTSRVQHRHSIALRRRRLPRPAGAKGDRRVTRRLSRLRRRHRRVLPTLTDARCREEIHGFCNAGSDCSRQESTDPTEPASADAVDRPSRSGVTGRPSPAPASGGRSSPRRCQAAVGSRPSGRGCR